MAGFTSRRPRATAGVLAATLCLTLFAGPATAAPAPGAPQLGLDLPTRPEPAHLDDLRKKADDDRADVRTAAAPGAVFTPALSGEAYTFNDFCGDAGGARLDLRRADVLDLRRSLSPPTLAFTFETCRAITRDDLLGGVSLLLQTDARRNFLVDIATLNGQLTGVVYDLDTRTVAHAGAGQLAPDGHGAGYPFPASALGSPTEFAFFVESYAGDGRLVDEMPEEDEPVGIWPGGACQSTVFTRQDVVAAPGRLATALASARAAGLVPSSVHHASGRFEVLLADRGAVGGLRALPGVAEVRDAELLPTATTETVATAAGADAWWRNEVRAGAATGRATGAGITIGVIDDGVDGRRSEFGGRVVGGYDTVRGRALASGGNSDRGGHGTLVSGVAAAASGSVAGIAPGAKIRPYQVFDFAGCGNANAIAAAIDRGVADRVQILNLSLGSRGVTPPVIAAALARAQQAGVLIVAAAGNEALVDQPSVPAEHPATIAVGATGPNAILAPYSNRAAWVELVAPGGNGSTATTGVLSLGERGGYGVVNGTSFAAPIVAGAAALYLEAAGATAAQTRTALAATARDLGATGRDRDHGFGLLDIEALLATVPQAPPPAPPTTTVRDITSTCAAAPRNAFRDVASTDTHGAGIDCVAHYAVAGGFSDGTYRPGQPVTRGQMATFIANTITAAGGTLPAASVDFTDVTGTRHEVNIRRLATAGVIGGYADRTYRPDAPVTRAQMATFLVRALEYRTATEMAKGSGAFSDVAGNTHEVNIGKAAGGGLTGGDGTGRYRPEGTVTRAQMGSFLARTLAYLVDDGTTTAR
ncbi:S8 family serine peptidase [Egicoccus sp. AB-alg6-2]|uniref:S8 family peptidase n=1 Tax=Egicoccus sp. AB-alg6-2 TaxID=3242692 RepID=UPI00359CF9DC